MLLALVLSVIMFSPTIEVEADTKMVNFNSYADPNVQVYVPWNVNMLELGRAADFHMAIAPASPKNAFQICDNWTLGMCPYEIWFSLPSYPEGRRTLRFSWPAFFPASFEIQIYTSSSLLSLIHNVSASSPSSETLLNHAPRQYARVLGKGGATRVPSLPASPVSASFHLWSPPTLGAKLDNLVPFQVMYEPLILGVIPSSLAPTLVILVVVVTIAWWLSFSIFYHLSMIADSVVLDTKDKKFF